MYKEILLILFGPEVARHVQGLFGSFRGWLHSWLYNCLTLRIDQNPASSRAVFQELKFNAPSTSSMTIVDRGFNPEFRLPEGTYTLQDTLLGPVTCILGEETITLQKLRIWGSSTLQDLMDYFKRLNKRYNSPAKITKFFIADEGSWSPVFRVPRPLENLEKTPAMMAVLDDIRKFKRRESWYHSRGYAYRKGYLLFGPPGTGKSSIIEIVAQDYSMSVYLICFNSEGMTDAVLLKLISGIPENSIVVVEEIDKQLTGHNNKRLSVAGLLTAIDGPQRLSPGTIVILTANKDDFLEGDERDSLLRKGRIDMTFHL